MRRVLPFKLMLAALLAACVTVNVYFPAAAAEQAADRIIDTITGPNQSGQQRGESATPQAPDQNEPPRSHVSPQIPALLLAAGRVLEALVPAAHAQADANLDISTPEIRAVTKSMQERFGQLEKYFDSGAIGLTADGLIAERDISGVPLGERALLKRLIAEDNRDRAALYLEIAKANGHPEWEKNIRQTFARRWVARGA